MRVIFLLRRLRLDVRLVSLCQECFPPSLREWLRFDFRLDSPIYECFPSSLREGLRLDVGLDSICYMPLCSPNRNDVVMAGKIPETCRKFQVQSQKRDFFWLLYWININFVFILERTAFLAEELIRGSVLLLNLSVSCVKVFLTVLCCEGNSDGWFGT